MWLHLFWCCQRIMEIAFWCMDMRWCAGIILTVCIRRMWCLRLRLGFHISSAWLQDWQAVDMESCESGILFDERTLFFHESWHVGTNRRKIASANWLPCIIREVKAVFYQRLNMQYIYNTGFVTTNKVWWKLIHYFI